MSQLYRLARTQPDVTLGLLRELLAILNEKGLLSEEETAKVLKGGMERWQNQA